MFIVSLSYKQSLDVVDRYLDGHIAWLEEAYQNDYFLFSGRKVPRTGGIIVANIADKQQLQELLSKDPFFIHGVADYEITEFVATKWHFLASSLLSVLNVI